MEQATKKRTLFEAELRAARMRRYLGDIMCHPRQIVADGAEDFDTSFGANASIAANSKLEESMRPLSEMQKAPARLSDAAEMEINKTIKNLCEKAHGENLPAPYKISAINSEDHRELFATEATRNENGTFSWTPNYPDFAACNHIKVELSDATGQILCERLNFSEPEKLKEASAS